VLSGDLFTRWRAGRRRKRASSCPHRASKWTQLQGRCWDQLLLQAVLLAMLPLMQRRTLLRLKATLPPRLLAVQLAMKPPLHQPLELQTAAARRRPPHRSQPLNAQRSSLGGCRPRRSSEACCGPTASIVWTARTWRSSAWGRTLSACSSPPWGW